jgi:F-type H+-transporting ATPase subunit delta
MSMVVANRYARALADVLASAGNYQQVLGEIENFAAAYHESPELRDVCDTPTVSMAQKLGLVEAIAGKMGLSHVTLNFLRVLMSHYRFPLLAEIAQAFRDVVNARLGIVQVMISSATELGEDDRKLLQQRFNELTQRQSELEFRLDGALIGGLVAQIGSTVYDGSIRGQLDRIRERLSAG